nr:MAG TPA: hypothetical protein [Caudoviricetes sp.]
MNNCGNGCGMSVCITPGVTVSDNYDRMTNKPKINGIELNGNKTSKELNLLSRQEKNYTEIKAGAEANDSFLVVLSQDGLANKIKLGEVTRGKFITVKKLPTDLEPGDYAFLLIGG